MSSSRYRSKESSAEKILKTAETHEADLIVDRSAKGLGAVKDSLGSVPTRAVQHVGRFSASGTMSQRIGINR